MDMKGDFYLLYSAILFAIGGIYTLLNFKSTEDPMLNLQMGIVFSIVSAILVFLFVRQVKRNQKK
jgi:TRAP-type C4-dicarboxylate transport system permease small subunit